MQYLSEDSAILLQSLLALVLGGLIGWEREASQKWAGLRTHMLVCLASFLFVKIAYLMVEMMLAREGVPAEVVQSDPIRIIEAVVTGLAFLGAGTIFRDHSENRARGLTTAASLLAVAPIGIAVALERYVLAIGVALLVVFVLRTLGVLEAKILSKK
ncbi:MgtC/SapB family protein [Roseibacillus ishigakijimensis]|uniref:MgtC/SapB family protein n=1 Tax=Roseibacillus ishigakijimensis TaxID=454146 RepID=A0A934VI34_9BACT|nr:MgtC/SapB family protein [Roseibacillus ishigakijimensis]MBK1834648.1 MgtC/SapB family protein [Roseibacillus ishigakijimensis]